MIVQCIWEHNGSDTLLYARDCPGAFTRGAALEEASEKMPREIRAYLSWLSLDAPETVTVEIAQEAPCDLQVRDADSDVLFEREKEPLTEGEYRSLKALALKSAEDFLSLYESIPNKDQGTGSFRKTFYGQVPGTAREMYEHTKNVNEYYFGEIEVEADNEGNILDCRRRGFEALEQKENFLENKVFDGSWGESWTLRKLLRRFIWHDRIHAKAMYRLACRLWGSEAVCDKFSFQNEVRRNP